MKDKLFTKQQVADHLQVSTRTVDRLIKKMKIPIFKVGSHVRIPESSIDLFKKSNKK